MKLKRNILAAVLVAAGWLAAVVVGWAHDCGPDCTGWHSYPPDAYSYDTALPTPGEAPREYFHRQISRSRGPYGNPPIDYEIYPENGPAEPRTARLPETLTNFNYAEPSELSQSYTEDYDRLLDGDGAFGPTNQKPGVFQKWAWRGTYIPQLASDDLGILDLETWVVFGLPFPTRDTPLLITPGFGAHVLDRPTMPDLPGTLYDVYLQFRWLGKINEFWGYDLVFTPGIYGDFHDITSDTWRYTGRAVGTYQWAPWTQLVFGVAYLDREDVAALPVGGVIYTPHDHVRWEAIFPRPRYARQYYLDCDRDKWWYIAGEFGGGSWTADRAGIGQDIVTLSDWRLLVGLETKLNGGAGRLVEIGYVFNRRIELASGGAAVRLDDNFVVRAGITF